MIAKTRKSGLRLSKRPHAPQPATFAILNGGSAVKQAVKTNEHLDLSTQLHPKRESPTSVQIDIVPPSPYGSRTSPQAIPEFEFLPPSTSSRAENDFGSQLEAIGSTTSATEPISPPLFPPGFVPNYAQTTGSNSSTSSESAPPSPPPEELEHEALLRSGTPSVPSQYRELHSALQSGWFTEYLDTRIRGLQPPSNEPSLTDPSHPVQLNTAAYRPKTDGIYINPLTWDLDLYFGKHECLLKQRVRERRLRGILDVNSDWMQIVSMAHKVLDASFVNLTKNHKSRKVIMEQAAQFLSAFHEEGAIWAVSTADLSPAEQQAINWWDSHFHDARPAARFARFRFLDVHFKYNLDAPQGLWARSSENQSIRLEYEWTAFAQSGIGIVASGKGRDLLTITDEGYLVIISRELIIREIPIPQLMVRVPYPEARITNSVGRSIAMPDEENPFPFFSSIPIFKLANEWAIPCVALGAPLVSAQHLIAANFGFVGGWAAASIGFFVATFPLLTLVFG